MSKKPILFYLSAGHGGSDPGAVSGKFIEADMARTVMAACYKELLAHKGRTYKVAYPEKNVSGMSLAAHVADMARYKAKGYRVVSIDAHFNAGGGDGDEVWVWKGTVTKSRLGKVLANLIIDELKKEGQNTRGIKHTKDLYFLKGVGVPVLVEYGFVDNRTDRKGFDTQKELQAYGKATARALIQYWEKYK